MLLLKGIKFVFKAVVGISVITATTMVVTKPSDSSFKQFLAHNISSQIGTPIIGDIVGALTSKMESHMIIDYILLKIATVGNDKVFIGAFGNWFYLK